MSKEFLMFLKKVRMAIRSGIIVVTVKHSTKENDKIRTIPLVHQTTTPRPTPAMLASSLE